MANLSFYITSDKHAIFPEWHNRPGVAGHGVALLFREP